MNATDVDRLQVPPLDLTYVLDDGPADAPAMEDVTRTYDYGSLADAAHFLAASLEDLAVCAGTRVGVLTSGAIDTTLAMCALSRLGASAFLVDVTALPSHTLGKLRAAGVHFLLADVGAESTLDEILSEGHIEDLPTVVADYYALACLTSPATAEASDMVFLGGSHPVVLGWGELVAVARSIARKRGLGSHSALSVPARVDRPGAVAAIFAGLSVGAVIRCEDAAGPTRLDGTFMHEEKDGQ